MRSATVVLPVPGGPVKDMCSEGGRAVRPKLRRIRSTRSSAAISRMRVFTDLSPTMTCDSCRSVVISALCSSDGWALCSPICAGGCMLIISSIIAVRHAVGACLARALLAVVHGLGDVVPGPAQGRPLLARCSVGAALNYGLIGSITVQRVVYNAIVHVLPRQAEAGIVGWPVDDKRERERLTPLAAIVGAHAY